jgi:hypothetical protein
MRRFALLSILALLAGPSTGRATDDVRVDVIEYGLYATKTERKIKDDSAPMGYRMEFSQVRLLEPLDEFCAKLGVEFGTKFVVAGTRESRSVTIDLVTRFPPPGQTNPQGRRFEMTTHPASYAVGSESYRTFQFEEAWEIVPGIWSFEFHHNGRKVGEKQFKVLPSCPIS